MIKITALNKSYKSKKRTQVLALTDIHLSLPDTGMVFLLGESGSGKSTLLNLIGGLDRATGGSIQADGNNLSEMNEQTLCSYRNRQIGFVFQDDHLIDELTVFENIALALELQQAYCPDKANAILKKVALDAYAGRYPKELSGGERQRVAIARAIIKAPRVILADEPTGNLDGAAASSILTLLKTISKDALVFIVSHNAADAHSYADRIITLSKGRIVSDVSKNADFTDNLLLKDQQLIYPEGAVLSDKDIALFNENSGKKLVKRTDKFIPTVTEAEAPQPSQLLKTKPSRVLRLSGKFLKRRLFSIGLYALIAAALMVVMALSQTVAGFDPNRVIQAKLDATTADSLYLTKSLTPAQEAQVAKMDMVSDCFPEIPQSDIHKFTDAGYDGKIYPVYKYALSMRQSTVCAGMSTDIFKDSVYISEPLGTMVVDEAFLKAQFGTVKFIAKAEPFHPAGVIITDYLADCILLSGQVSYATDYASLLGEYHWGTKDAYSCISRGYINGIIDTGYKNKYPGLFSEKNQVLTGDIQQMQFIEAIHTKYGFCYSLNPDFSQAEPAWQMAWHYALQFDDKALFTASIAQVRPADFYGLALDQQEVLMDRSCYNRVFGTAYTPETADSFTPHSAQLRHLYYFDAAPLFAMDIQIVGLFESGQDDLCGTLVAGKAVYDAFAQNHSYTTGLYFSGGDTTCIIETAKALGYRNNLAVSESVQNVSGVATAFIPIFRLIAVMLCVAVVLILLNFCGKMINSKRHEIGIMKAMGAKNSTIAVIFGLQVALIAVLTGILSTVGYRFFVRTANDLLVTALQNLTQNQLVLYLDFLAFDGQIALQNCLLIAGLALIAFIAPLLRIRRLDPVKIIKQ